MHAPKFASDASTSAQPPNDVMHTRNVNGDTLQGVEPAHQGGTSDLSDEFGEEHRGGEVYILVGSAGDYVSSHN